MIHIEQGLLLCAVGLLMVPTAAAARECQECEDEVDRCFDVWSNPEAYDDSVQEWCDTQPGTSTFTVHRFPIAPQCIASEPDCRACGFDSECHYLWQFGECHEECASQLAALTARLQRALAMVSTERLAHLVHFAQEIDFDASRRVIIASSICGPGIPAVEFTIEPQVAFALQQSIRVLAE
jgi:hypothetical protein